MDERDMVPISKPENIRFFIDSILYNSISGCKIIEKKRNKRTISGKYRLILHRETFKNRF